MVGLYLALVDDDNDKMAYEQFYNKTRKKLFLAANDILYDEFLAEDAVADAFFKIAVKFDKLKHLPYDELKAYAIIVVRNISKNFIRNNSKITYTDFEEEFDDKWISDSEWEHIDEILLKEKIKQLNSEDKEILLLYYFYRYSLKEISRLKKMKYDVVQKRIQKIRKQLKVLMEEGNENVSNKT